MIPKLRLHYILLATLESVTVKCCVLASIRMNATVRRMTALAGALDDP